MPAYLIEPRTPEARGDRRRASPRARPIPNKAVTVVAVVAISVAACSAGQGSSAPASPEYYRPDLPPAVELLLTTQTGGESDVGDLVATFDWLHATASPVSPAVGEALAGGHAVDPEVLLSELGD
jgi:hypothetical protein